MFLAVIGTIASLAIGFLAVAEGIVGVEPTGLTIAFLVTFIGTFALLGAAVVSARRALDLRDWRTAWDAHFLWWTVLSVVSAVGFGLATALSNGSPAVLFWVSAIAAYASLMRWTWWLWRAIERAGA